MAGTQQKCNKARRASYGGLLMRQLLPFREGVAKPFEHIQRSDTVGHRTTEEVVLIGLCVTGTLALLPVVFMHFMAERWMMGSVVGALIVTNVSIAIHVWHTHKLKYSGVLFAVAYMATILAEMYFGGASIVYWVYPAMAVAYFFLPIGWAIAINAAVMALMMPMLAPEMPFIDLYRIVASLAVLNIVACLFARRMIDHRELLTSLATRDSLTGVGNRRALKTRLREMVALHDRRGGSMSLAILDVDFFKNINDEMGHSRGDQVLIKLAEIIHERIRLTDGLYRFGGDEFVILLNETGLKDAMYTCEQLRELIERSAQDIGHHMTVSIGMAELAKGESADAWLHRADVALYQAKKGGRNLCESA